MFPWYFISRKSLPLDWRKWRLSMVAAFNKWATIQGYQRNKIFIISILLVIILKHHLYAKPPWLVRVELKVEHAAFAATSSSKSHIRYHGHPLTHPSQAIPYLFKVPNTISCHTICPTHRITIPEMSGAGQKARKSTDFFIYKSVYIVMAKIL